MNFADFLGFFEHHKLLFAFQISLKLQLDFGNINQAEIEFFMKGNIAVAEKEVKCPVTWLTSGNWKDIQRLEEVLPLQFKGLSKSVATNKKEWKKVRCDVCCIFKKGRDFNKDGP